jgi:hypothetical protein
MTWFSDSLQPDFDRMRQLAYFFRRADPRSSQVRICTLFPEFATMCAVAALQRAGRHDFERGEPAYLPIADRSTDLRS